MAVASYAVESVTSLAKKDLEVPEWRRGSYGMAWGRAVHRMLEIVGRGNGKDVKLYGLAKNVLVAEEMGMEKKVELVRLVESIVGSDPNIKAYWIDHARIMASSGHGFLSRDLNLDEIKQRVEEDPEGFE